MKFIPIILLGLWAGAAGSQSRDSEEIYPILKPSHDARLACLARIIHEGRCWPGKSQRFQALE